MNNLLRGGLAGAAAYKFGGGIISTILIFILVFWLLVNVSKREAGRGFFIRRPAYSFQLNKGSVEYRGDERAPRFLVKSHRH